MQITAIDCHAHVMEVGRPLIADRHSEPAHDASVADYLALLDAHGVSHGLLTAPSFYGTDNSLLLEALAKAGGRLRGTVIVDPAIDARALEQMQRQGVCGIRLNWLQRGALPPVAEAHWQQHLALAAELGLHVHVHLEGRRLPEVLPHLLKSGVRVVLDHFARPEVAEGVGGPSYRVVLDALAAGRTWVKLSAPYRMPGTDMQPYVDALLKAGGAGRLVWATDWPFVGHETVVNYPQCIADLQRWIPDEAQRCQVLVDTPRDLFGY